MLQFDCATRFYNIDLPISLVHVTVCQPSR